MSRSACTHQARLRFLGVETQPLQYGIDAGVVLVPAHVTEPLLVAPESFEHLVADLVPQVAQLHGLIGNALLQRDDLTPRRGAGLPHGGGPLKGAVLVEQRVTHPRRARHGSHVGRPVTGHHAENRRFAGTVAPDDAPTLPFPHGEGDVLEQFGGTERNADVGTGEESHADSRLRVRNQPRKLTHPLRPLPLMGTTPHVGTAVRRPGMSRSPFPDSLLLPCAG
jgi:hypothetical protein